MAAGTATLRLVREERLEVHAAAMGERLAGHLRALQRDYPQLGDVRGQGLMLGVEVVSPDGPTDRQGHPLADGVLAARLQQECLRRGLIIEVGGRHGAVLRFLPPLIVQPGQVDQIADCLATALRTVMAAS